MDLFMRSLGVIEKSELTIKNLCNTLAAADLDFSLNEEGHVYVKSGLEFPMWIDFHKELSAIRIFTYAKIMASSVDEAAGLELANRMNMNFIPNQIYYMDQCIYSSYTILAFDRLSERLFLDALKHCASAFLIAAQESDQDGLFREGAAH